MAAANNTSLGRTDCPVTNTVATLVYATLGCVSVLVCLAAVIQFFVMKLHRKLLYRLALYQVLSALVHGMIDAVQMLLVVGSNETISEVSRTPCIALAFLHQYAIITKLMFTVWVTFHIFCYVVLVKNPKKLEPLYVVTSLLVPFALSIPPLITKTYGVAGSWCWIQSQSDNCPGQKNLLIEGVAEQFALFYVPALIALLVESVAMVAMVTSLCYKTRQEAQKDDSPLLKLHSKILKQIVPLAAYPILFSVLILLPLVNRVYNTFLPSSPGLVIATAVCVQLWSVTAGVTLIVHMGIVWKERRKREEFH